MNTNSPTNTPASPPADTAADASAQPAVSPAAAPAAAHAAVSAETQAALASAAYAPNSPGATHIRSFVHRRGHITQGQLAARLLLAHLRGES